MAKTDTEWLVFAGSFIRQPREARPASGRPDGAIQKVETLTVNPR
jgi:hypothetical protein